MSSFSLADEYVADTMAIVLHLENRKSSANVKQIFDEANNGKTIIHIPAIVFAEILYLSEKSRISLTIADVKKHLQKFSNFRETPLNFEIIEHAGQINDIPELHDRLIAATAKFLNLELITNDQKIINSIFVKQFGENVFYSLINLKLERKLLACPSVKKCLFKDKRKIIVVS